MSSSLALLVAVALGVADAQLRDFIHFHHKHKSDVDYCLTAVGDPSGTDVGSLSMRKCSTDDTQRWKKQDNQAMVSAHQAPGGQYPCVSITANGPDEYALTYNVHEHCVPGFKVDEQEGFWTLDNFLGTGKMGCVAATSTSNNFYIAKCSGSTSDTCKGATVPSQPDKKCLDGWKREGVDLGARDSLV